MRTIPCIGYHDIYVYFAQGEEIQNYKKLEHNN